MSDFSALPVWNESGDVHVVVETPRGAGGKMKFEPRIQAFVLSRALLPGLVFPYDFGFVPSTKAEDGDPLDAFVMHSTQTWPGLVLCCTAVGVVKVVQREARKRMRNDRIVMVPKGDKIAATLEDARKLPAALRQEIEKFFSAADVLEDKSLTFLGWGSPAEAQRLIKQAARSAKSGRAAAEKASPGE